MALLCRPINTQTLAALKPVLSATMFSLCDDTYFIVAVTSVVVVFKRYAYLALLAQLPEFIKQDDQNAVCLSVCLCDGCKSG